MSSDSDVGSKGERKSWIKFEEQPLGHRNGDQIGLQLSAAEDGVADGHVGVATIEPSHCVQMSSNIPDSNTGNSGPQRAPQLSLSLTNNVSNNITANGNNNVMGRQSAAETSAATASAEARDSLQNIPLKDVNNCNQCNHSSPSNNVYSNGDVIVTLLPLNSHCSWLTPARFKPELVPEELMAQRLSLTVEDYVSAMSVLINDFRFNLYITLYKRILFLWIAIGFLVLLALLFSGIKGLALFGGGILWLVINALGIFATMWMKIKLYHLLERCIAHVNSLLYKYNILIGVDDRGKISCHKINLVFIYFDVTYCIKFLKDQLESEDQMNNGGRSPLRSEASNAPAFNRSRMDIDMSDIVITGATPKSLSQKEKFAEKLLLRYSQRWVKDFVRKRIDLHLPLHADAAGVNVTPLPSNPRHCVSSRCLCQFIEEHLKYKPLAQCNITELFM